MKKYILQKRAVRLIDNSATLIPSDSIFFKFNILKINDMVDLYQTTFMYTNGFIPDSFENIFNKF